jgi:RimJ/RimL family protein N-acetyltransferase
LNIHLQTPRLNIRPIDLKDAGFMFELVNTDGWLRFIGDRNVGDLKEAENYIKGLQQNPNIHYHTVKLKDSKEPIGVVTLIKREEEEQPDIGFAFLPRHQKQGYALEASKSFLDTLLASNAFDQLIAITLADNLASIQLLERLGFSLLKEVKRGEEKLNYYHHISS